MSMYRYVIVLIVFSGAYSSTSIWLIVLPITLISTLMSFKSCWLENVEPLLHFLQFGRSSKWLVSRRRRFVMTQSQSGFFLPSSFNSFPASQQNEAKICGFATGPKLAVMTLSSLYLLMRALLIAAPLIVDVHGPFVALMPSRRPTLFGESGKLRLSQ